jgi:hypothetical protein
MRLWRQRKRSEPDAAKTSLKRIRAHLAALGYDTRDLTDEELVARIERFSHVSAQASITMQQGQVRGDEGPFLSPTSEGEGVRVLDISAPTTHQHQVPNTL